MKNNILKLAAVGLFIWSLGAQAGTIYNIDRTVGSGTISGTIETNGTIGSLSTSDILNWSFDAFDGTDIISISSASGGFLQGNAWSHLSATPSQLLFDFDGALADSTADLISFHGEDSPQTFSFDYNLLGNFLGKLEQLVHQFEPDGEHLTQSFREGVVVIGTIDGAPSAPASYDYQHLDHPGTADTQVFGVNGRGDVVGVGFDENNVYPFVYSSRQDRFTNVAPAAGHASTAVLGISASGVMVGSVTSSDLSTRSGFIRGKDGTFTFFSHPDAVSITLPRGVNSDGLVSGYRDSPDGTVGFIYDPETETFTDIVPSLFTIAHGINSKGDVVGSAIFFDSDAPCDSPDPVSGIERYGWLRAADGSVTYFQINGQRTQARGINDAGFVVGDFLDPDSGKRKGFIIKLAGSSSCESVNVDDSDALEFPGFSLTLPEGIRNSGDIVGIVIDESGVHGFTATPR